MYDKKLIVLKVDFFFLGADHSALELLKILQKKKGNCFSLPM